MATMYALFLGLLLTAVCGTLGTGDGVVIQKIVIARNVVTRQSDFLDFWIIDQGTRMGAGVIKAELLNRVQHDGNIGRLVRISPVETSIHGIYHADIPIVETQCIASLRQKIIRIASAELGVRESTGNNDGPRVEEYLRYTHLGKGHAWCAAFVSWCYGQAGLTGPRNPWSPALFPQARTYWKNGVVIANKQTLNQVQGDDGEGGQVLVTKEKNGGAVIPAWPKTSNSSATAKLLDQYEEKQIGHQIFWMPISSSIQKIYRPRFFQRVRDGGTGRLGIGQKLWSLGLIQGLGLSGYEDGKAVRGEKIVERKAFSNRQLPNRDQGDGGKGGQVQVKPADIFGIYGNAAKRINHVGLVKETQGNYLISIEGNSNNKVESRRRHLSTIYALADWVSNQ